MKTLIGLAAAVGMTWVTALSPAHAITSFTLSNLDGSPLQVHVTLEEVVSGPKTNVQVTLDVDPAYQADLQGAFFHLSNESLLAGLQLSGTGLTGYSVDANNVSNLAGGNNINGQVKNTYGSFDVGLTIGTPGIGSDDYASFMFIVSHATQSITEDMFHSLPFAVRATSVGPAGEGREGSSKLAGYVPDEPDDTTTTDGDPDPDPIATPEPATAALGLMGLASLAMAGRRRR